jgi:TRAP-type C4-dicarboxylate transport system permease small subunit
VGGQKARPSYQGFSYQVLSRGAGFILDCGMPGVSHRYRLKNGSKGNRMLAKYKRLLDKLHKIELFCAISVFGFIILIITMQVIFRYFFNKPFSWVEELASLLLIYLTFITADIVYAQKGHLSVAYFVNFLSKRQSALLNIILYIAIGIFLIAMIPSCIELLNMQWGHFAAAVIIIPKSFWSLPVPIVFFSMFLTTIDFIVEEFERLNSAETDGKEAA